MGEKRRRGRGEQNERVCECNKQYSSVDNDNSALYLTLTHGITLFRYGQPISAQSITAIPGIHLILTSAIILLQLSPADVLKASLTSVNLTQFLNLTVPNQKCMNRFFAFRNVSLQCSRYLDFLALIMCSPIPDFYASS